MIRIAGIIILFALIAFLVLAVTVAVYFFIYKRNINKALVDRESVRRRMPPPYKVLIVASVIIFVGTILFISIKRVGSSDGENIDDKYYEAKYSFNVYQPEEMTGYLSVYSIEENVGYKKYVEEQGDVRVTYFLSEDAYDTYHPEFIAYVEYLGDKEMLYYGYSGKFLTPEGTNIVGMGAAGADAEEYFVVVGSSSIECVFGLDIYYYDTQAKGDEMEDGAAVAETVKININPIKS